MSRNIKLWMSVKPGEVCEVCFDRYRAKDSTYEETQQDVTLIVCKTIRGEAFCPDGLRRIVNEGKVVTVLE